MRMNRGRDTTRSKPKTGHSMRSARRSAVGPPTRVPVLPVCLATSDNKRGWTTGNYTLKKKIGPVKNMKRSSLLHFIVVIYVCYDLWAFGNG